MYIWSSYALRVEKYIIHLQKHIYFALRNNIVISFLLQALLLKYYAIMSTMATPHNMSRVLPMAYVTV